MSNWPEATLMRLLAATGIFLVAAVYLRGWRRLARPALPSGPGRATDPASTRGRLLFLAGLALLAVALISPLGYLATQYFSARIVQHMLVVASVPSLLMFANPAPALVYGLPARARGDAGRAASAGRRAGHPPASCPPLGHRPRRHPAGLSVRLLVLV